MQDRRLGEVLQCSAVIGSVRVRVIHDFLRVWTRVECIVKATLSIDIINSVTFWAHSMGPYSGPLCHALSFLLWTSHAACAIAIAGVRQ